MAERLRVSFVPVSLFRTIVERGTCYTHAYAGVYREPPGFPMRSQALRWRGCGLPPGDPHPRPLARRLQGRSLTDLGGGGRGWTKSLRFWDCSRICLGVFLVFQPGRKQAARFLFFLLGSECQPRNTAGSWLCQCHRQGITQSGCWE